MSWHHFRDLTFGDRLRSMLAHVAAVWLLVILGGFFLFVAANILPLAGSFLIDATLDTINYRPERAGVAALIFAAGVGVLFTVPAALTGLLLAPDKMRTGGFPVGHACFRLICASMLGGFGLVLAGFIGYILGLIFFWTGLGAEIVVLIVPCSLGGIGLLVGWVFGAQSV